MNPYLYLYLYLLKTGSLYNEFQAFDWPSGNGVYEPLYHAREVATINCFLVAKKETSKAFQYYLIVFNKTIIPLALVGYEMIIANSALRASLAIYHLISNARSWNNS